MPRRARTPEVSTPRPLTGDRLLAAIAATDSAFSHAILHGRDGKADRTAWRGRCLYCDTALWLELDGRPITEITVEHVLPRARGGTNDLANLALACRRCNQEKGARHDGRKGERADAVVAAAVARRASRWRTPSDA